MDMQSRLDLAVFRCAGAELAEGAVAQGDRFAPPFAAIFHKKILCGMGPTASGKTDLAIALRRHLPVELISVDSAMVYRDGYRHRRRTPRRTGDGAASPDRHL